jgi:hypothetical protein
MPVAGATAATAPPACFLRAGYALWSQWSQVANPALQQAQFTCSACYLVSGDGTLCIVLRCIVWQVTSLRSQLEEASTSHSAALEAALNDMETLRIECLSLKAEVAKHVSTQLCTLP